MTLNQIIITITIITFAACLHPHKHSSKLDAFVLESDDAVSNANTFDLMRQFLFSNLADLKFDSITHIDDDSTLLKRKQSFWYSFDSSSKFSGLYMTLKEYQTNRQAAQAFKEQIDIHACCIPDEDLLKLKNFKNLEHFKNSASITLITNNVLIVVSFGGNDTELEASSKLLDEIPKGNNFHKLVIGHGGPAVWSIE